MRWNLVVRKLDSIFGRGRRRVFQIPYGHQIQLNSKIFSKLRWSPASYSLPQLDAFYVTSGLLSMSKEGFEWRPKDSECVGVRVTLKRCPHDQVFKLEALACKADTSALHFYKVSHLVAFLKISDSGIGFDLSSWVHPILNEQSLGGMNK